MFSRVVVLVNRANVVIEIRESRHWSPNGCYSSRIELLASERREIRATKFNQRSQESSRPTVLEIFVRGAETKVLTPQDFIDHAMIIFEMDDDGGGASSSDHVRKVIVKGVKAKVFDICRLRGLGFLGRDYPGRPEEIIS